MCRMRRACGSNTAFAFQLRQELHVYRRGRACVAVAPRQGCNVQVGDYHRQAHSHIAPRWGATASAFSFYNIIYS
jgi:hypothetical protein